MGVSIGCPEADAVIWHRVFPTKRLVHLYLPGRIDGVPAWVLARLAAQQKPTGREARVHLSRPYSAGSGL
jgi:hypothetical protein